MLSTARALPSGCEYGNARVRALVGQLLDRPAYDALAALDLDGLLSVLADGPYGPDLRAALPRHRGLAALQAAVSGHLARTLRALRGWYGGAAAEAIDLLLTRWDVHNAVTVLRALARRAAPEQTLALLVPVGRLDEPACVALVEQAGVRPAATWLVEHGLPTPQVAHAAAAAVPAYERTGDLAPLEQALARAHAAAVRSGLATLDGEDSGDGAQGEHGAVLGAVLRGDVDRRNLLLALRLRESRLSATGAFLPGGRIPAESLADVAGAGQRTEVVAVLAAAPAARPWDPAVAAWARDGDLLALERATETLAARRASALLWRTDALGIGVPVAFAAAAETEARNLRLLGYAAAGGIPAAALSTWLVPVR